MPTVVTHSFVSIALAPVFRRQNVSTAVIVMGGICCVIPDIDAIGFLLGIPYNSIFGHRGFTHSLLFAFLLAGVLTPFVSKPAEGTCRPWVVFLFLFLCTVSHPLLDALTDGGYGVALFSPFSNERFFFPWRPIKVSPLGVSRFLSGQANPVIFSELKWVAVPCLSIFVATLRWRKLRARLFQ